MADAFLAWAGGGGGKKPTFLGILQINVGNGNMSATNMKGLWTPADGVSDLYCACLKNDGSYGVRTRIVNKTSLQAVSTESGTLVIGFTYGGSIANHAPLVMAGPFAESTAIGYYLYYLGANGEQKAATIPYNKDITQSFDLYGYRLGTG